MSRFPAVDRSQIEQTLDGARSRVSPPRDGAFWEGYLFRNTAEVNCGYFALHGPWSKGVKVGESFYCTLIYPINATCLNLSQSRLCQPGDHPRSVSL